MKILDRYIFKELVASFVLGLLIFTFVLLMNSIFQLVDLFINKNVPVTRILQLVVYLSIGLTGFTVPIAVLFCILITYSKFSHDNEITILRSSGINTLSFIWQPLVLSITLCFVLFYLNFFTVPRINYSYSTILTELLQQQKTVKFDDKTFIQIDNYKIYISKVDKKNNVLNGVYIYKLDNTQTTRIFAQKGKVEHLKGKGLAFVLYDGTIQNSPTNDFTKLTQFSFNTNRITIPYVSENQITQTKSIDQFTINELSAEIRESRSKMSTASNTESEFDKLKRCSLETEYQRRLTLSTCVIFFCLLATPLGITLQKGSKSIGAGVTLVVITVYWFMLAATIILSNKGLIPANFALWSSNLVVGIPALIFNRRMLKK